MSHAFHYETHEYKRDYNIVKQYANNITHYIQRMTGDPIEDVEAYVKRKLKDEEDPLYVDPDYLMLHRPEGSTDRKKGKTTLMKHLKFVQENKLLMSPTMTVYQRKEVQPSIVAEHVSDCKAERNIYKKGMFQAEFEGDSTLYQIRYGQQTSAKIEANSPSGAQNSEHSAFFCKTIHSTLTGECRITTAMGNANNEKFITGNRHYFKPDIITANIATNITLMDMDELDRVIKKYNLVYPSVQQTMDCIYYSSDLYLDRGDWCREIEQYVECLLPVERAAFVYTGDLYHLKVCNEKFVRQLISDFVTPADARSIPEEDLDSIVGSMDDAVETHIAVAATSIMKGKEFKTLDPSSKRVIASNIVGLNKAQEKYYDLIRGFWTTDVVPPSISTFPSVERRCVIAGDTDSTIFTTQYWVKWYFGKIGFEDEHNAVSSLITYFVSNMLFHLLALICASQGISEEQLHRYAMKNEFFFTIFMATSRSKHYLAWQQAQEGKVFSEQKSEIKGAELRNAKTAQFVADAQMDMFVKIRDEITESGKIRLQPYIMEIARIENVIREDIKKGGFDFFRTGEIKVKSTYKNPQSSHYRYYEMWNQVFGPKYGEIEEPPYRAISFKVEGETKSDLLGWVNRIEDKELAKRLRLWMEINNVVRMSEVMLPLPIVSVIGVPDELIKGANLQKVIYNIMSPFYVMLESLGVYLPSKPNIVLVSDLFGS
jgi:hypothetical protein